MYYTPISPCCQQLSGKHGDLTQLNSPGPQTTSACQDLFAKTHQNLQNLQKPDKTSACQDLFAKTSQNLEKPRKTSQNLARPRNACPNLPKSSTI